MHPRAAASLGLALAATLLHAAPHRAGAQTPSTDSATGPSEGLWVATQRYGPDVRGRLLLFRDGAAWRAEIAGHQVGARRGGDTISFALPDSLGSFVGRLSGDARTVRGHWVQPRIMSSGMPYSSPLVLRTDRPGRWVGDVVPLEDRFTIFLRLTRNPDGTLGGFIRNPERNVGRQVRLRRLERRGNEVSLVGQWNGRGEERVLAQGAVTSDGFALDFPGRGTFAFHRVAAGETTDYYPRGRPAAPYTYRPPPALDDGWPVGTLESVGLSADTISAFMRAVIADGMDSLGAQQVHAVLIARHGTLVLEEYFHGYDRDTPHDTRSASKSMTATLAGAVIRTGALSLSSPVYAVMNGGRFPPDLEPRKRGITLEHFMSMASGIDCDDENPDSPGNESNMIDRTDEPDYYRFALALKTIREPGTKAVYCSVQPVLVGGVIKHATGRAVADVFDELVAEPLGMRHYYLNLSPLGEPYMGGGMRLTARDFAKFGQLYLNGGTWRGRRVLDPAFIARASDPRFTMGTLGYGLHWWVIRYPFRGDTLQAYFASGNGGQHVMVVPRLDLVITTLAGNYQDRTALKLQERDIPRYILPAVRMER